MNYHWNWHIFWEDSPDGIHTYLDTLWLGLGWTLATALSAWVIALLLGTVIGTLRTVPNKWLSGFANAYVELFRNIPVLVQMFVWFFVIPELLPTAMGDWIKALPNSSFYVAVISLAFFTSSRVAVHVGTGIATQPRGQRMAGTALGMTMLQTYRYILLPMAMRMVIPPLTSEFMNVIKNSAVAFSISLVELMGSTRAMQDASFQIFEPFCVATIIYLTVNVIVVLAMRLLEKRFAVPGFITSGAAK